MSSFEHFCEISGIDFLTLVEVYCSKGEIPMLSGKMRKNSSTKVHSHGVK